MYVFGNLINFHTILDTLLMPGLTPNCLDQRIRRALGQLQKLVTSLFQCFSICDLAAQTRNMGGTAMVRSLHSRSSVKSDSQCKLRVCITARGGVLLAVFAVYLSPSKHERDFRDVLVPSFYDPCHCLPMLVSHQKALTFLGLEPEYTYMRNASLSVSSDSQLLVDAN